MKMLKHYPCIECDGSGYIIWFNDPQTEHICENCRGTGVVEE